MTLRRLLIFALLTTTGCMAPCRADELVFGVSTGSAMPMTEFSKGQLTGGLIKDFGDALARELHYQAGYVSLPRKRVEAALADSQVDLLCDLRPEWLDKRNWLWSETVFSNDQIIVNRRDTAPLKALPALAGERTGTILGYRYPRTEKLLGPRFVRDDAASDDVNLSKLINHRFRYVITNSLYFDYQLKTHPQRTDLAPAYFKVMTFDTYCALPPRGKLDLPRLNQAIGALRRRGDIDRMMDRYRLQPP
jgi:polar amino acid transport system substrate-binding protein